MHAESAAHLAAILNAGYFVRHYSRPQQRELRSQAVRALALATRAALENEENAEATLFAVADALRPPTSAR